MENTDNESYGLEHIHQILLQAALKFDEVCRRNGISYALHGGTLLGAERNNKFIPWDDDFDVSMTRSEYQKLQNVAKYFPDGYELDEKTMWFPRLVLRTENDLAYIDILVWDYISSNKIMQKIKITVLRFFQGMLKTHIEYKRFNIIYKFLLFVTHLLGKLLSQKIKIKIFNYICKNAFTGDKKFIHRSNDAYVGVSYIFDSSYMDEYCDIKFENHLFMVNKRYHEFLERNYGLDYLTPPPKKDRIPEHEKFRKDL